MAKCALYPGSFDTLTLGHLNIVARSARLFDRLVVGVTDNPRKRPLFRRDERVEVLRGECARFPNVSVSPFDGLTITYAQSIAASVIVRGLRAVTDFEYELQIAIANHHLDPAIETLFLPSEPAFSFLSSSVVKEIARLGGDVRSFVPAAVAAALEDRFAREPDA